MSESARDVQRKAAIAGAAAAPLCLAAKGCGGPGPHPHSTCLEVVSVHASDDEVLSLMTPPGTPPKTADDTAPPVPPNELFFEILGDPPLQAWAQVCDRRDCKCSDLLVLATPEGREALLAQVHASGRKGEHCTSRGGPALEGITHFLLDAETAKPYWKQDRQAVQVTAETLAIAQRIDGDTLDALRNCWTLGRGYGDPEQRLLAAESIPVF